MVQEDKSAKVKSKPESNVVIEDSGRVLKGSQTVMIDHYKLQVAKDRINFAPMQVGDKSAVVDQDFEPQYVDREHVHFFHSYDSSGKKQVKSTMIGGHFHPIEVIPQGAGKRPKIVVGPAMKEVKRKDPRTKKWVIAYQPSDEGLMPGEDSHTHKWDYLWSEEAQVRAVNLKAVALEQAEAQKQAGPKGVIA
jgi:hypothetical protein